MEPKASGKSAMEVGESLREYEVYSGESDGLTQRERQDLYRADDEYEGCDAE